VGEDFNESTFEAAYNYYRTIYKKVTPEDIKSFEERYRFGPMEEEDLVSYYNDQKGSMAALIESIPLSSNEDIPRFIKFFEESIENKTLPKLKLFEKTKGKIRLLKDESAEFEEERLKDMGALVAAIQGKSGNRQTDFISEL
jgi:DnaJ family protein C protein 9